MMTVQRIKAKTEIIIAQSAKRVCCCLLPRAAVRIPKKAKRTPRNAVYPPKTVMTAMIPAARAVRDKFDVRSFIVFPFCLFVVGFVADNFHAAVDLFC